MKYLEANKEFEEILLSHGFIDSTSKSDKFKGKKSFKTGKNSQKEIYFNYINIEIFNRTQQISAIKLSEHEIKLLLMFFKMPQNDIKEILYFDKFTFNGASEKFNDLKGEIQRLKDLNYRVSRQIKLQRIISFYEGLNL